MYADPRVVGGGYTAQGLAFEDWDTGARATAVPDRPDLHMQQLESLNGGGFARSSAGALENFGRGWTSGGSGWSVLEGEKPMSYSLGGMARTGLGIVYDGLTGAGEFRQAGKEWDRGNYGRATINGMAGVGTAGLTALTLGEYALAKVGVVGMAGTTGLHATTDAISGASLPLLPRTSLSNVGAREFYLEGERQIGSLNEFLKTQPLSAQERAVELINTRNALRSESRLLMADQELAQLLNRTDPNLTVNQLLQKAQTKGLSGNDAWDYLAKSASTSRASVNQSLGLKP